MNLLKNTPRKLFYLVIAFFFVHLFLQMLMLFLAVGVMSTGIEFGQKTFFGDIIFILFMIVSFPIISLGLISPTLLNSSLNGWILWPINSALWSLVFYLLVRNRFKK